MPFWPNVSFKEFQRNVLESLAGRADELEYKACVSEHIIEYKNENYPEEFPGGENKFFSEFIGDINDTFDREDWNHICTITGDKVRKLRDIPGSHIIFALALHYRLHAQECIEKLRHTEDLDNLAFGGQARDHFGANIFTFELDDHILAAPSAPMLAPPYKSRRNVERLLKDRLDDSVWLDPHNHHSIPKFTRIDAEQRLTSFVEQPGTLKVLPLIGPSGAGKTRLISEWMRPYVLTRTQQSWEAGFITSEMPFARDPTPWRDWEIKRNTLVAIDYTHAFNEVYWAILDRARAQDENSRRKIRLILIDHVMPEFLGGDFAWSGIGGGHPSRRNQIIAEHVEDQLQIQSEGYDSDLLKHVAAKAASLSAKSFEPDDPAIAEALGHLDRMAFGGLDAVRHPLFAALIGQVIGDADDKSIDFSNWSRRDLLAIYFDNPNRMPWAGWQGHRNEQEKTKQALIVGALVAAATLRSGLPIADIERHLPPENVELIQRANRIVSSKNQHFIRPFIPDILGETFVLKFLEKAEDFDEEYARFCAFLSDIGAEKRLDVSVNFVQNVARLARNLANDDIERSDVFRSWSALAKFLDPSLFKPESAIRPSVSVAIAYVIKELHRAIAEKRRAYKASTQRMSQEKEIALARFLSIPQRFIEKIALNDIVGVKRYMNSIAFMNMIFMLFEYSGHRRADFLQITLDTVMSFRNEEGFTASMVAARSGYTGVLSVIARYINQDLDARTHQGITALSFACLHGQLPAVAELIYLGAKVDLRQNDDFNALITAGAYGHLEVVEFLVQHGANIDARKRDGASTLMFAAQRGHLPVVEFLHEHRADIEARDKDGWTAIMRACLTGELRIVKWLTERGADIDARTHSGRTALNVAAENGHRPLVDYLAKSDAAVNTKDDDGHTALTIASRQGHLPTIECLVGHHADIDARSKSGWNALMHAVGSDHLSVVEFLIDHGADVNARDDEGVTAAMIASEAGQLKILEYLIEQGANINQYSEEKVTALMLASQNGFDATVEILLDNGADINGRNADGGTALIKAINAGHRGVIECLVGRGADLDAQANDGATALMSAVWAGNHQVIDLLTARGANINAKAKNGWTALMLASQDGQLSIVERLVELGAEKDAVADYGFTALTIAIGSFHFSTVELLIAHGANTNDSA